MTDECHGNESVDGNAIKSPLLLSQRQPKSEMNAEIAAGARLKTSARLRSCGFSVVVRVSVPENRDAREGRESLKIGSSGGQRVGSGPGENLGSRAERLRERQGFW
jgi:hypothetical protein